MEVRHWGLAAQSGMLPSWLALHSRELSCSGLSVSSSERLRQVMGDRLVRRSKLMLSRRGVACMVGFGGF